MPLKQQDAGISMRMRSVARSIASVAAVALLAGGLAGCKTASFGDVTGSLGPRATTAATDPHQAIAALGERYRANPRNVDAALRYGQALRANGQRAQAAAVLEQATIANPGNKALLAAYGRALADNGSFQQAFDTLSRAHTPENPDWRILSAQGAALDQLGRHQDARGYYEAALKIAPGEPAVLSNFGMSYLLTRDLASAERVLRQAYANGRADTRARQNLALVVGLQGRFAEAQDIAARDLPADEAAANVAYLKDMLRSDSDRRGAPVRAARS
jgi:Flp pilus assembly protein TadD